MVTNNSQIYQFQITLKEIKPKIWCRIQVPSGYNFWDLHVAIQDAMGWSDYHLYQFTIINPKTGKKEFIGIPEDEDFEEIIPSNKAKISKYFVFPKDKANYEYDFGDGWEHEVILEKVLPVIEGSKYPQCIAGERACPPEDCGGIYGYENLLEIIRDPKHKEYKETIEWLKLLSEIQAGDTLIVWKLDRMGRYLHHLIKVVNDFIEKGVDIISLQDPLNTTTAQGRLIFNIFASLTEFEKDLIRERTMAGLRSARVRGRMGGRPKGLSEKAKRIACTAEVLYTQNELKTDEISVQLGISKTTLYKYLRVRKVQIGAPQQP